MRISASFQIILGSSPRGSVRVRIRVRVRTPGRGSVRVRTVGLCQFSVAYIYILLAHGGGSRGMSYTM